MLALLAVSLGGCDDLLEENPLGTLTDVNFYRNATDALAAVNAAYAALRSAGDGPSSSYLLSRDYYFLIETPTHVVTAYSSPTNVRGCWDVYTCNAANDTYAKSAWFAIYDAINRANAVIDNVPGIEDMDAGLRARVVAEAKFLRAFHYFNLVRLFGGVPLFVNETASLKDLAKSRSSADEVYDQVVKDLSEAAPDLPVSYAAVTDWGRATRGAAQTLLGKVYLQRGVIGKSNPFGNALYWPTAKPDDLSNAVTQLRAVMASGRYALVADYASMWEPATERNSEVIWSAQNTNLPGSGMTVSQYISHSEHSQTTTMSAGGELPFWESYEAADRRRNPTWLTQFTNRFNVVRTWNPNAYTASWPGPSLNKYLVNDYNAVEEEIDVVLLRYADVLLMLSEALAQQNGGAPTAESYALLNQVRARAGVAPLANLSPAAFREAMYRERNWELATEQHTWYDGQRFWELLTRDVVANARLYPGPTATNTRYRRRTVPELVPVIEEPKHRLMPIPTVVRDRNANLTQNPGW